MYHSNKHILRAIHITIIMATLLSCKRELATTKMSDGILLSSSKSLLLNENGNSAAAHIAASEKLSLPAAVELPQNLPSGNARVATYFAVGVQQYKARIISGSNPAAYEWVLAGPNATLWDISNNAVGTHGFGPFWEISPSDSIFAQHFSPAKTAPSPDPENVDWLLLKPKAGTTPTGLFAGVHYIQRIATKGGKAPLTPPSHIDETVAVKYKAVYRFSRMNP